MHSESVAPAPGTTSLVDAAAVPAAAQTAWRALFDADRADLQPGERVLIHGGAGSVGTFALQFARMRGAHVVATGRRTQHDVLAELGAHQCIGLSHNGLHYRTALVDAVIDLTGDLAAGLLEVLRPGGTLTTIARVGSQEHDTLSNICGRRDVKITSASLANEPDVTTLSRISDLIDGELLHVVVSRHIHVGRVSPAWVDDAVDAVGATVIVLGSSEVPPGVGRTSSRRVSASSRWATRRQSAQVGLQRPAAEPR